MLNEHFSELNIAISQKKYGSKYAVLKITDRNDKWKWTKILRTESVYGLFWQSNMNHPLDFCQDQPRKELNIGIKFIYSEKATKFFKISTNHLSYVLPVK